MTMKKDSLKIICNNCRKEKKKHKVNNWDIDIKKVQDLVAKKLVLIAKVNKASI